MNSCVVLLQIIFALQLVQSGNLLKEKRGAQYVTKTRYIVKDKSSYCKSITKLNRRQLAFCFKKPSVVKVLETGFKLGIGACIDKFMNNSYTRWNCTSTAKKSKSNVLFGIPMATSTKEAAVMQAFGSVGMFLKLTQECINGNVPGCPSKNMYQVCKGNGVIGRAKTCSVINWDAPRKLFFKFMIPGKIATYWKSPNKFMSQFNTAFGTVALMASTIKGCECTSDGRTKRPCLASSSCKEELPVLEDLATYLIDKFLKAKSFKPERHWAAHLRATYPPEISGGKAVVIKEPEYPPEATGNDLVYYVDSPLYCEPLPAFNWGGIGGRECRPDVQSLDRCSLLCCGFGHMIMTEIVKRNCEVQVKPRISIKCETQEIYKHHCKYIWMVRRRSKRGKNAVHLFSLRKE